MKAFTLALMLTIVAASAQPVLAAQKKSSAPDDGRAQYSAQIASKWGPQIKKRFGMTSSEWTEKMIGTFTTADIANLKRAAAATSFDGMAGALYGGSSAANIARARPTFIGSTENDLVFTPLPPCRIVDTRLAGGPLAANSERQFQGWTSTDFAAQGGSVSNCGVPENASAVVANIVAVNTAPGRGFLTAFPADVARPDASTLNFVGNDISNQISMKLCRPGCEKQFSIFSTRSTQVVVDVYGYYMEPLATALDCTSVTKTGNLLGLLSVNDTASCATGYTATGGACSGALGITITNSGATIDASGENDRLVLRTRRLGAGCSPRLQGSIDLLSHPRALDQSIVNE